MLKEDNILLLRNRWKTGGALVNLNRPESPHLLLGKVRVLIHSFVVGLNEQVSVKYLAKSLARGEASRNISLLLPHSVGSGIHQSTEEENICSGRTVSGVKIQQIMWRHIMREDDKRVKSELRGISHNSEFYPVEEKVICGFKDLAKCNPS